MSKDDALKLAKGADELYVSKGTKVVHVDLKHDKPDSDSIAQLMLGPTGNLRAPTLRVGKTLIVGFNADTYAQVVQSKN